MNLYIWKDPYKVNYGHSMLIVMAESVEEAKRKAIHAKWFRFGNENKPRDDREKKSRERYAKELMKKLGEPRIASPISAEFHEWSE
ncbi:hypothetical protein [Caulobacter phage Cr30]|uniref:hypothetical protein n=1 Tax=Caulobacter phage Cr30 TaxID=1357714 RepID=UPI0004A9BA56|nr:hypothetical protein OZ74_gp076 [Caulobacter phage Cr30]AGS80961.1 hypothetical protein [Caulobacter phage Cr30]